MFVGDQQLLPVGSCNCFPFHFSPTTMPSHIPAEGLSSCKHTKGVVEAKGHENWWWARSKQFRVAVTVLPDRTEIR